MDCAKVWLSKERMERKDGGCPICRTVSTTACSRLLSLGCCAFTRWCCGVQPVVELLNVISKEKEPVAKD